MTLPATQFEHPQGMAGTDRRDIGNQALPAGGERLSLARVLHILRRRKWTIVSTAIVLVMMGLLLTLMQPKIYMADATVRLTGSNRELAAKVGDEMAEPDMKGDSDVATELEEVQSLEMARRIVEKYKLVDDRRFNPYLNPPASTLSRLLGRSPDTVDLKTLDPAARARMKEKLVRYLKSGLATGRVGTSYSIAILYRHHDPEVAAMIANAYASEYTQSQVKEKKAATSEAIAFLSGKVEELRSQATADYAAVQNYRIANGLPSTSGASLAEQDISVYNQQAATARAEAAADVARLNTARAQLKSGSAGDDVGEALGSPVISALRSQRGQLVVKLADLRTRYGERHPDLLRARQELADLDRQIQDEIDRVISNLEAKSAVSSQRLASLSGTLGSAKGQLLNNNRAMVALDDLQKRAEASQGLYESYLARYRETSASSGTERPDARILTLASPPNFPFSPNILLNLMFAGVCGVSLGLAAAMLLEMQFRGLTTAADVEARTGLPYLGMVPENGSAKHHRDTPAETLVAMPNSVLAESMRSIHASIQMPGSDRAQVIAITSSVPAEGKSVLSALLGMISAQMGSRTIVVDCDIFRRGLSHEFGAEDGDGLMEIAATQTADIDRAIRQVGDNLDLLPIISRGREGDRLTDRGAIQSIVARLKERYDLILLDCPPLLAVAEAREIAGLADGVIVAARWRKTPDDAVKTAARLLPAKLAPFVGVVLTRVDLKKQSRYAPNDSASYYAHYQKYAAVA